MKILFTLLALVLLNTSYSQNIINSNANGIMEFKELDHGLAKVKGRITENLENSPTDTHGWLQDFEIIDQTDSIQIMPKANFGVIYIVNSKDTIDIDVVIEWVYPQKIKNDKGEKFKSIKYTTRRPTNIPSASSYSLDEPYEMVKGNWKMNIYIENKLVLTRTFTLY